MKNLAELVSQLYNLIGQTKEVSREQFHLQSLTHTQMHYLEIIHLLDNPNITELASKLKLTKPTVKVAVDKLIEGDYLYKIKSDEDRRRAHLHLTEKGQLINQMHDYTHKRVSETICKKLNNEEMEILVGLLNKVLTEK